MDHERRRAPRYPLIAEAEITELRSNSRMKAKTSDVSVFGCFMNAVTSLPMGTKVEVKLKRNEETFIGQGEVARVVPMGMGVNFSTVKQDQKELMKKWLAEVNRAA